VSSTEFLDKAELRTLTGYCPLGRQQAWLKERNIPHQVDGKRLLVCRVHVRAWVEGRAVVSSNGPNWSAVA
jgi:hypothetical protein